MTEAQFWAGDIGARASHKKAELWEHNGKRLPLLHENPRSKYIPFTEIVEVFLEEVNR